jgi:hypothetical protein
MKKTYSESELKELANEVFAQFPTATEAFATTDGNIFLRKNHAALHAGPQGRIILVQRPIVSESTEAAETENKPGMNVPDTIAAIKKATTLNDLEPYATDTRLTVIKAVELRKKAIEATDDILNTPATPDTTEESQKGDTPNATTGTNPEE